MNPNENEAIGHLKCFGYGSLQAAGVIFGRSAGEGCGCVVRRQGLEDDAINDGLDGVIFALFEAHALGDFDDLSVDAGAETLLIEGFEFFAKLAFAAAHHGGIDGDSFTGGGGNDTLDDLVSGLAGDGTAAVWAVGLPYRSVEEAEVVVDLGDSADGGAG